MAKHRDGRCGERKRTWAGWTIVNKLLRVHANSVLSCVTPIDIIRMSIRLLNLFCKVMKASQTYFLVETEVHG